MSDLAVSPPLYPAPMLARYRIAYSALAGAYLIADEHMGGAYCSLPDESGRLVQLRFRSGGRARDWLVECGKGGDVAASSE